MKELLTNTLLPARQLLVFSGCRIDRDEKVWGSGCSVRMKIRGSRDLPVCFMDTDRLGMNGACNRSEVSDNEGIMTVMHGERKLQK